MLTLAACGDNQTPAEPDRPDASVTPPYTVGGSVTGSSGALTLRNNGGDALDLAGDGAFTFAVALENGARYEVTVSAQPDGQSCTVENGSGTIDSANVADVSVTCANNRDGITTFSGILRDQNDTLIAGATLTIGGVSATSAADGTWTVTDAPTDGTLFIDAGAEFLPLRVDTSDFPDGVTDQEIMIRRADLQMTIDPSQPNDATVGEAFVQIPALPGIDEDLDVKGWYYDSEDSDAMASVPVPLRGSDGTTDYGLLSRGMIGMTFTGAESGTAYTDFSNAGEPFRVAMPMSPNVIGLAPNIDLWRATDDDDTWQLDGTATYDTSANAYRFEVTRWSIYNLDNKGELCNIRADFAGHTSGDTYNVTLSGPTGFGSVTTKNYTSNSDFIAFSNAAKNFTYSINATKVSSGQTASGQLSCSNTPITLDFARDTTPPGPISNAIVQTTLATCSMTVTWTNPSDSDYAGVDICVIPSRLQTSCTRTPVTKTAPQTSHVFTGADGLNCGNQQQTFLEFRTFDNKNPRNAQTNPITQGFTMQ